MRRDATVAGRVAREAQSRGRVRGAHVDKLRAMLAEAGFTRVEIKTRRSRALINQRMEDEGVGELSSALITAYKP